MRVVISTVHKSRTSAFNDVAYTECRDGFYIITENSGRVRLIPGSEIIEVVEEPSEDGEAPRSGEGDACSASSLGFPCALSKLHTSPHVWVVPDSEGKVGEARCSGWFREHASHLWRQSDTGQLFSCGGYALI